MKNKLILLISILALSCSSDTSVTNATSINLVTGVAFRQFVEDEPLQLGNPNTLVNNKFTIYPNPAIETFYIVAEENITDIWIVPANPKKIHQEVNFSSILNTNLYSEQSINSHSDFSLNGQSSNNIGVTIATLDKGYYRVFVKIGGTIYWDNLYKYDDQENTADQIPALIDFWN